MTLDDDLRTVLGHESGSRPAPPPDLAGLIRGGRSRRRRRTVRRTAVAAASAVLIGAGGYGILAAEPTHGPRVASPPDATPPPSEEPLLGNDGLAPGTHRVSVGRDDEGDEIEALLTIDGANWISDAFPRAADPFRASYAGVGVYEPLTLIAGDGCLDDPTSTDVGRSPRRLAEQLARLPRSTVIDPPAAGEAFGMPAFHLALRVDSECYGYYRVAQTDAGDRGITYPGAGEAPGDVIIDFWVLDVRGALVVVDQWNNIDATSGLVDQVERARTSITFARR